MLRKSPMNYLAATGVAAMLWIATGLLLGNYLGDNVSLQVMTTDRFLAVYRVTTVAASALALALCCWWYASGGPAAAADPRGARKRWLGLMIGEILVAAVTLIVFVVMLLAESLVATDYLMILAGLLLDTALFFWVCTLTMSPRPVMAVVPGKR